MTWTRVDFKRLIWFCVGELNSWNWLAFLGCFLASFSTVSSEAGARPLLGRILDARHDVTIHHIELISKLPLWLDDLGAQILSFSW